MAGVITQVDLTQDGSGPPDTFVQVRFPSGETPTGSVSFYQPVGGGGANDVDLIPADTATFTGSETPAFSQGGFDFYNLPAPDDFFDGGPDNAFAVVYADDNDENVNAVIFGDGGPPPSNVSFSGGGPLSGKSIQDAIDDPSINVAGGAKQPGTGPFAVGEDGTVTSGPSDPNSPVCFAAGTPIATPGGERAVETLKAGDLVLTADGRAVPVKWIGYQTVHKIFTPAIRFYPVRIKAGALGENTPHVDLVVTGDHGILVGGVMVNAAVLVNGTTIVREAAEALPDRITYWHVETQDHAVILAAGAAAETFVDATTRASFDNYAEYVALFGEASERMAVLPYPRVFSPRQLPERVRLLLAEQAAVPEAGGDAAAA